MRPTEERSRKIKWLKRYRIYREMHRIYSGEYSYWDGAKQAYGSSDKKTAQWLAAAAGAEESAVCFSDWADKTACVCAEIYTAINALESDEALVLTLRYIEGLDWSTIAKKCNYSKRQIFRLHSQALDALDTVTAEKRPPSLRYVSDFMFQYASSANVVGAEVPENNILKADANDVFAD